MKTLIIILVYCLAVTFYVSGQTTPQEMLNKAIYEEEVNGNLEEAIKLFLEIVEKNSTNRTITAEAFYHLGLTNEKLGNKKAKEYYQKVVNNFADQPEFVRIAKERLSRLVIAEKELETPLEPKFTKINIPTELSLYVKLSPDGKELAVVSDKKLWKLPLSGNLGPGFAGTPNQINTDRINVDRQAGLSWSYDGKWIAFNELPLNDTLLQKKGFQNIYVVPAEGGKPTKVIENFRTGRIENFSISLSPDGKNLAHSSFGNKEQHVYTTPVAGGSPKQLMDIQAREPAFSSDGKWIAYVEDKNFGTGGGNLWIVPAAGGIPKLIAKAGYATSPVWSPDNSMIAFVDDDKKNQINVVEIPKEGKEIGNVINIAAPEGTEKVNLLAGWSTDNKIAAMISKKVENAIYSLPVNGGIATEVLHDCWAMMPRWSPDGSQIYYTSSQIKGSQQAFQLSLGTVSANGGTGIFLPKDKDGKIVWQLGTGGGNRISPDGKTIVSAAWQEMIPEINFPLVNIWKITTDGSKSEKITNKKGHYFDFSPSWSPDGNKIAFIRAKIKRTRTDFLDTTRITTINSSGGEEEILVTVSDKWINSLVWSPDGKMLAYLSAEKEAPHAKQINFINAENGTSMFIWEVPSAHNGIELAWAPDSRRIAFNDDERKEIKIMNVEDGNIEDIKTNLENVEIGHIDWSPNGEKFVFAGSKEGTREFWFLEDFLPLEKLAQKNKVIERKPLEPKFKKIKIPTQLSWSVALSPDGKDLALVSDKKLWKMPLSGSLGPDFPGTPVQLNTDGIEVEWSGLSWSQDGKWIAFNDNPKLDDKGNVIENQSIYVVPSDGGKPKKVIGNFRDVRTINYRISLSPNGNNLAFSSVEENKQHIFSTPVDKAIPRQLVEMEAREPVFSPDGKYIAFVKDKNKGIGAGNLGLWVIEANGGKPYKLADAGKASSPIWSPDGKLIAFLDYSVGKKINIVQVLKEGQATEKPIIINAPENIEEVRLLAGWTPDNKIGALMVTKLDFGLYTLPSEGGQAAKILHDSYAVQPRWSRNCEQIYYVATPEEGENRSYRRFLASVSASGGKGKPLKTNIKGNSIKQFSFQSGNRISPDGNWIITSTWTPVDTNTINVYWPTSKIWKVSFDGEDAIQVTNTPGNFTDTSPCWSADGKKIAFVQTELVEGKANFFGESRIYVIDSNGGEPELLDPNPSISANNLIWSPDGKMIAYLAKEKEKPQAQVLKIIDMESRDIKTIEEFPNINININTELVWSPDSKRIAFNDEDDKVIKIMNLDDGSIENIETGLIDVGLFHLDWSPDGKRFVFGGWKGGNAEFWFLEDFLPNEEKNNKQK